MNIDGVTNGIVLDHIKAGTAMEIYQYLNLEDISCQVAVIKNVNSQKMGKKDIIKIDSELDLNLDVLGYLDHKMHLELPETLRNIIFCKNPRCITTTEQEAEHVFRLVDREKRLYRCLYCDAAYKRKQP